jgi:hypothetical protein
MTVSKDNSVFFISKSLEDRLDLQEFESASRLSSGTTCSVTFEKDVVVVFELRKFSLGRRKVQLISSASEISRFMLTREEIISVQCGSVFMSGRVFNIAKKKSGLWLVKIDVFDIKDI